MSDLKTNLQNILQEKQDKIIPENIKKDIQIFDVTGTYEGSGGTDTSDATATAEDIMSGKTAYIAEGKVTGTYVEIMNNADYQTCLSLVNDIMGNPAPAEGHIYGVKRLRSSTNTLWERTNEGRDLTANATHNGTEVQNDFDNIYPWSDIISFDYDSTQQLVTAYYGDENFTFSPSDTKVNVFTKIPRFWYKRYIDEDDYEHIEIADYAAEGFLESKEFAVARYSYEGSTSAPRSCSGLSPLTSTTGVNFRKGAKLLGDNICLFDWRALGIIQLLYLVEYANNNSQEMLGNGVSRTTVVSKSGQLDNLGMKSGCLNNDERSSVMYRGIEDIFGNIHQLIDGINVNGENHPYVCIDSSKYKFNKYNGDYVKVSYANDISSGGYISKLGYDENYPLIMLPVDGPRVDSESGFTDFYRYSAGDRVIRFGGYYLDIANCGLFAIDSTIASADSASTSGARLLLRLNG